MLKRRWAFLQYSIFSNSNNSGRVHDWNEGEHEENLDRRSCVRVAAARKRSRK